MELTPPRLAIIALALSIVGGSGVYGWAELRMLDTLQATRNEVDSISYERGGTVPSVARVREQVEAIAAAHGVELRGLEVVAADESGVGAVGAYVGNVIEGRRRVFSVTAEATAHKMGFTRHDAFDVRIALRLETRVAPVPGRPEPGSEALEAGDRTLRRGL